VSLMGELPQSEKVCSVEDSGDGGEFVRPGDCGGQTKSVSPKMTLSWSVCNSSISRKKSCNNSRAARRITGLGSEARAKSLNPGVGPLAS
jgi:hypothetical protein